MQIFSAKHWISVLIIIAIVFNIYLYNILNQPEALVEGWDFNTSRNISTYILPNSSLLYWKPAKFCEQSVFLLIFVVSTPSNFAARNAIRKTWSSNEIVHGKSIKTYFLLGETLNLTVQGEIENENKFYNDIVQGNFIDSYNNLTIKSVAMLNLIHTYCSNSTFYVMKCDDDTFVNTAPLIRTLNNSLKHDLLTGRLICHAKPIKNSNNKWYAPNYMFSGKIYPDYLSGSGYVFSVDVASKLYSVALETPLFYLEDVFLTGICASNAKIKRLHNPDFKYEKHNFSACAIKYVITSHHVSPKEMHKFYSTIKTTNVSNCKATKIKKKRRC